MIDKINEFIQQPLPRRILFFDDMITPSLMRTGYWLGLLAVAWMGLHAFFSHGFWGMFEAIVFVAIGVIVLRMLAELVMLLFKIHDQLEKIADNTSAKNTDVLPSSPSRPRKKRAKKAGKKVGKKVTRKSTEADSPE